jgi:hypothetical protein
MNGVPWVDQDVLWWRTNQVRIAIVGAGKGPQKGVQMEPQLHGSGVLLQHGRRHADRIASAVGRHIRWQPNRAALRASASRRLR